MTPSFKRNSWPALASPRCCWSHYEMEKSLKASKRGDTDSDIDSDTWRMTLIFYWDALRHQHKLHCPCTCAAKQDLTALDRVAEKPALRNTDSLRPWWLEVTYIYIHWLADYSSINYIFESIWLYVLRYPSFVVSSGPPGLSGLSVCSKKYWLHIKNGLVQVHYRSLW